MMLRQSSRRPSVKLNISVFNNNTVNNTIGGTSPREDKYDKATNKSSGDPQPVSPQRSGLMNFATGSHTSQAFIRSRTSVVNGVPANFMPPP
jgi:hypothetical protein